MSNVIYMSLVGLAVVLSMKAAAAVLLTLLPLAILALVLAVPIALVMGVGWVISRGWRGFQGEAARGTGSGEVLG
jgi:uncharacterized membrane protein